MTRLASYYPSRVITQARSCRLFVSRRLRTSIGYIMYFIVKGLWLYFHEGVIKWTHFLRYWTFVRGVHRSPVNFHHKGQWEGALMFSLICAQTNGWVNNLSIWHVIYLKTIKHWHMCGRETAHIIQRISDLPKAMFDAWNNPSNTTQNIHYCFCYMALSQNHMFKLL